MKIVLNYNPDNGYIEDNDGMYLGTHIGLDLQAYAYKEADGGVPVDALTKLKDAGFDASEIIDLHRRGVIGR